MWNILTQGKRGYTNHPETKRWKGKLRALYRVHEEDEGRGPKFLTHFRIERILPLIGDGETGMKLK